MRKPTIYFLAAMLSAPALASAETFSNASFAGTYVLSGTSSATNIKTLCNGAKTCGRKSGFGRFRAVRPTGSRRFGAPTGPSPFGPGLERLHFKGVRGNQAGPFDSNRISGFPRIQAH